MNRISISGLFLLVGFFVHVHSAIAQKFEGGALGGLSASQVAGDKYSGFNKAGIFGGGYVALHLSERNTLRLELDYIQKGSRKNANFDKEDYDSYIIRVDYVEMPLLLQRTYGKKIIVEAGPAVSFLMKSYEAFNKVEISDAPFRKQNISIIAGVSYKLGERLSVGLRTNNSVVSIRVNNDVEDYRWRFGSWGQFNDVLVLNLSYRL
jgi:hypothetical protein